MGSQHWALPRVTSPRKMLLLMMIQPLLLMGCCEGMFSDDYDPSDIPPDQAGYSYPVPADPLELPSMEVEYDDYDPNGVPADQAAPAISGYLSPLPPPEYDDPPSYYDDYDPNDVPEDQAAPAPDTGYSYPVPDNPLVLRRRGKTLSSSSARRMSDKMMMKKKMTMKKERRPKELMMKNKMMHESMGMEEERMTHHRKSSSSGMSRQGRRFRPSPSVSMSDNVRNAKRRGRQIMSVSEWLHRG